MKLSKEYVRDGKPVVVSAEPLDGDRWRVRVGDQVYEFGAQGLDDGGVRLAPASGQERAFVAYGTPAGTAAAPQFMVRVDGRTQTLVPPAGRSGGGAGGADGTIRAPMTGTVLDVLCKPGDTVTADQTLVVLSAMKMEHKLTAGIAGVVQSLAAQKGGTVDQGAVLAVVQPASEAKGKQP